MSTPALNRATNVFYTNQPLQGSDAGKIGSTTKKEEVSDLTKSAKQIVPPTAPENLKALVETTSKSQEIAGELLTTRE